MVVSQRFMYKTFSTACIATMRDLCHVRGVQHVHRFPTRAIIKLFRPMFSFFQVYHGRSAAFVTRRGDLCFRVFAIHIGSHPTANGSRGPSGRLLVVLIFGTRFSRVGLGVLRVQFVGLGRRFVVTRFIGDRGAPSPGFQCACVYLRVVVGRTLLRMGVGKVGFNYFFARGYRILYVRCGGITGVAVWYCGSTMECDREGWGTGKVVFVPG